MNTSDCIGFGAALSWGLWWLIFPGSVIKFYRWFHRGKTRLSREIGVRVLGAIWLVLVLAVLVSFLRSRR